MKIMAQNADQALAQYDLAPREGETLRAFLCRIITWVMEQEEIVSRIPWWVPVSIVKHALHKALQCNN